MDHSNARTNNRPVPAPPSVPEDWEDWEEDEITTPVGSERDHPLVQSPPRSKQAGVRHSIQKPKRLFSRGRQKAQNAKAGIRLVTDMSNFRKQQHIAHQLRSATESDARVGKFVDAAALRALEGTPTSASVGSFAWLKRKQSEKSPNKVSRSQSGLSPADRPIVIGIALPEDDIAGRVISPQTAVIETPMEFPQYIPTAPTTTAGLPNTREPRSVWSPDTEDGSPFHSRAASSVYSQASHATRHDNVPPVPSLPSAYVVQSQPQRARLDDDDDDAFTPVTLFEEDGSPVERRKTAKSMRSKGHTRSPATIATLSGWWDHVQTPFREHWSPSTPKPQSADTEDGRPVVEWPNEKQNASSPFTQQQQSSPTSNAETKVLPGSPASAATSSRSAGLSHGEGQHQDHADHLEKRVALGQQVGEDEIPNEEPPPYELPSKHHMVRYRAVFPPGHPLRAHFPASPAPVSPGLANTMTSQGAISMTDVPLTPAASRVDPNTTGPGRLPDRAPATFVPTEHFLSAAGDSPAARAERQRRRHEKEDYVARKVEGFWKGRGCMPQNGCYGRRGREGRKRRRICLGVLAGFIAAIVLIVVLAVTLTHKTNRIDTPYSPFLNLTGFPPIPTGVLSVVGPENAEAVGECVQPSTLWSCALPKEQQAENTPFAANQPTFVLQIQFDNNTRQLWDVPDGPIPTPKPQSSLIRRGRTSVLRSLRTGRRQRRDTDPPKMLDPGFNPIPSPPSFQEMFFLGKTSDNILSSRKAGEPTPFYISFLHSVNETVGPNVLSRRGIGNGIQTGSDGNITTVLDPVETSPDGTGPPARMLTLPTQQPLRLFDRGLPTEHYGFYTFFDKSIYLKSITALTNSTSPSGDVPTDENGGAAKTEAKFFVNWGQTRFHVQIWTRTDNSTMLLSTSADGTAVPPSNNTMPGTFPYPITISEDLHGGDHDRKGTLVYPVDDRQQLVQSEPKTVLVDYAFLGTSINHAGEPSFGGIDGGTGGCLCRWNNFRKTKSLGATTAAP